MTEHKFDEMRAAMVASQLRTTGVSDQRVLEAMSAVPRERFVAAGREALAYADRAIPLSPTRAIPAPEVLGRLLTDARPRAIDRALVIGAASGYAAAVLAHLVASVVALEEDAALPAIARGDLPATVVHAAGPLAAGWPAGGPYDLILFDGAVERVPPAIVAQLAPGGRIAAGLVERGVTRLALGREAGGAFAMATFADVATPILPGFAEPAGFIF